MILIHLLVFAIGLTIVVATILSAIRTFVLPRGHPEPLTRYVFITVRRALELFAHLTGARTYDRRDHILAFYAPLSLLTLLPAWYSLVTLGYACMFWAVGVPTWLDAFRVSGSSLLTLGFVPAEGLLQTILAFTEALNGLILVAMLIAYLPTIYAAFQRREALVTLLEVRAGAPPSAIEMLERYYRIHGIQNLSQLWASWETWFADIEESHTSLGALVHLRSPVPRRHWVIAAGTVLDGAALTASTLDLPRDPQAELCLRAGYLALRKIANFLNFRYNPHPQPTDPISITREEFDAAYDRLASAGIALKPNRDQCWRDFAGWRVNYDTILLGLADLTMAPPAPWSSDRSAGKVRELRTSGRF
jgi:hypothetical protein